MPQPITMKAFKKATTKRIFPAQDEVSAKRLVELGKESFFTGVHNLQNYEIPAIYLSLDQEASKWASKANGTPEMPAFRFLVISSPSGNIGFECLLEFPGGKELHLFLNPADPAVKRFLRLLAKGEVFAFSFYFHQANLVYTSYSGSHSEIQAWGLRNLALAKKVGKENDLSKAIATRRKMFGILFNRRFIEGAQSIP